MKHREQRGILHEAASPGSELQQLLAVLSVAAVCFVLVTTEYLPVGLIPAMSADLRITNGTAGLTMTVPAIMAACSALVVSVIIGKTDRRVVLIGLTAIMCGANLISFMAPTFGVLLFGRLLIGVALGGFWPLGISLGPKLMPEPTGARGATIIFSGLSLGTIAGVPAGTLGAELLGWRAAFGAASAISLLAGGGLIAFLPALRPSRPTRWRDLGSLAVVPQARLGLLLALLTFGGMFFAYPYIGPFLGIVSSMKPDRISLMLVIFGGAGFFGNMLGGWMVVRSTEQAMIVNAVALALPVFVLALLGASGLVTVVMICVWGLAYGALSIVCQSWMARAAPHALETGGALYVATVQLSVSIGAWLGGAVVDELGVVYVMIASGMVVLLAAPLAAVLGSLPQAQRTSGQK